MIHSDEKATAIFVNSIDCKNYLEHNPPTSVSGDSVRIPTHNIKQLSINLLSINGQINSLSEGLFKCEKYVMLNETTILSIPHFTSDEISIMCNNLNL